MSSSTITFGNANPIVSTSAAHLPRWAMRRLPRDSAGVWRGVVFHTFYWRRIGLGWAGEIGGALCCGGIR